MQPEEQVKIRARRDAFTRVAFWQYMTFIFLLCFVWVIEILDIPHRAFGTEQTPFNLYRVCLLTAAVIGSAVIAIGHTYEQQRTLLRQLLKTCLYCHRVKTSEGKWEHVEEYFIKYYPVSMERGACPACEEMLSVTNEKHNGIPDAIPQRGRESGQAETVCAAKAS